MMVKVAFEEKYNANKSPNDSVPVPVAKKIIHYIFDHGIGTTIRYDTPQKNKHLLIQPFGAWYIGEKGKDENEQWRNRH